MLDARAQAVLDVWFGAPDSAEFGHPRKAWFKKDASFDAMLHERFGALIEEALEGRLASWSATPLGALIVDRVARPVHPQLFSQHVACIRR